MSIRWAWYLQSSVVRHFRDLGPHVCKIQQNVLLSLVQFAKNTVPFFFIKYPVHFYYIIRLLNPYDKQKTFFF